MSVELLPSRPRLETVPIFVLGLQRSGTTWLANLLCRHASCVGIQSDDHGGIHESVFFSHFSRSYGDLKVEENFQRFASDFAKSDYFLLSNLPESWLQDRADRDYREIFYELMEHVARREGATHWVEKSPHHTLYCHELAKLFPNARFVCLLRQPTTLIPSLLNAPWRQEARYPLRTLNILRSCITYALYRGKMLKFAKYNPNVIIIDYENLVAYQEDEMKRLCLFLGISYRSEILSVPYGPNSSFRSTQDRSNAVSHFDHLCMEVFLKCLRLIPQGWLDSANKLKQWVRPEPWPDWVWRRLPLENAPPTIKA